MRRRLKRRLDRAGSVVRLWPFSSRWNARTWAIVSATTPGSLRLDVFTPCLTATFDIGDLGELLR
jgi:hypothetical protein